MAGLNDLAPRRKGLVIDLVRQAGLGELQAWRGGREHEPGNAREAFRDSLFSILRNGRAPSH